MEKELIDWKDFSKIDMRVGTIIDVKINKKTNKPAYIIWIDFGFLGVKKTSAQITNLYSPSELKGQQVIAVMNFPPKQIADMKSEVLLLGAVSEENNDVIFVKPERNVQNGLKIG
tara:strand:+ start:621 stop:965 length:345 start_codon:yes stop_codon:yes gene_type:complete